MAVGHGSLHELLTWTRNDRYALRYDLQLACGLTLSLNHNRQALAPSMLSPLGELRQLSQGEFDLTLLWSGRRGCLRSLGLA